LFCTQKQTRTMKFDYKPESLEEKYNSTAQLKIRYQMLFCAREHGTCSAYDRTRKTTAYLGASTELKNLQLDAKFYAPITELLIQKVFKRLFEHLWEEGNEDI